MPRARQNKYDIKSPCASPQTYENVSKAQTIGLQLALLRRIPPVGSKSVTAQELWQQVTDAGHVCTLRTVQRQLSALIKEFDIDCLDQAKPFAYIWKGQRSKVSFFPGLETHEALLLVLAEEQLRYMLPASVLSSLSTFFEQANRKLENAHLRADVHPEIKLSRQWLDKVRVVNSSVPMTPPHIEKAVFETVSNALFANQILKLDYENAKGEKKTKYVHPLGLAQQGVRMFLVCRFEGYDNERNLAMHRIYRAVNTGQPFTRPVNFNLLAYEEEGRFAFGDGQRIELELWVSEPMGRLLTETRLSADQILEPMLEPDVPPHRIARLGRRLRSTVVKSSNLVWWLRGQGNSIHVLHPKDLVVPVESGLPID